ncbi:Fe(III) dicitrate transport protein FecA [Pseudomonas aeruginosa]|nr:Fe(III) dicitrate transport protein FecA [Pseudomonas aeruginosa]
MSPSRALSPLSRALLLACLGGPVLVSAGSGCAAEIRTDARQYYRLPAEPLEQALNHLGRQAGVLIAFSPEQTAARRSQALDGEYTLEEALAALLAGSGLEARARGDGAYTLEALPVEDPANLQALTVVGDWLADASAADVFEHPGARDVVRREQFQAQGAASTREVLERIPGVSAPLNNGTGSHDLALNFGIRGLNPRLASRSTVLMDGIPVPFAPYGQPQLSLAPVSIGNMDAVDVVRGGGAVRYGPQNVGGIVNFVTRAIPEDFATKLDVHSELSPSSSQDGLKTTHNVLIGGTSANGLGGALLYSGTRGGDWREHSDTRIDDLILKGRFQPSDEHAFSAMTQYYDGEADMPGGLGTAAYRDDPYQSTRPYDKFWGRRTLASASYEYTPNASQKLNVTGFFTKTLRSGYLDQGRNLTLSPREYWVRGLETRFSQGFELGESRHEVGIGHRYVNEASHELRYWTRADSGQLPSTGSRNDRDTRGSTEANAFYIDDRIGHRQLDHHPRHPLREDRFRTEEPAEEQQGQRPLQRLAAGAQRDLPPHAELEPLRQHRGLVRHRAVQPDGQGGAQRRHRAGEGPHLGTRQPLRRRHPARRTGRLPDQLRQPVREQPADRQRDRPRQDPAQGHRGGDRLRPGRSRPAALRLRRLCQLRLRRREHSRRRAEQGQPGAVLLEAQGHPWRQLPHRRLELQPRRQLPDQPVRRQRQHRERKRRRQHRADRRLDGLERARHLRLRPAS